MLASIQEPVVTVLSNFFVIIHADGYVVFESVKFPGQHVGIKPDGSAKPPDHTGTGDHARFTPQVLNEVGVH